MLRASVFGLIPQVWLDRRKGILSSKSARLVLHTEDKTRVLPLYREIIKDVKPTYTNTRTDKELFF